MTQISPADSRIDRSSGFSLAEVLVALAIAAMLAVVLTRFASNTRLIAGRIRELVEMMSLSNYLLEKSSMRKPVPDQGRTAGFAWRISVDPISYTAVARRVSEEESPKQNTTSPTFGKDNPRAQPPAASKDTKNWIPFRMTIVVEAPSGRQYTADTIGLGPPPKDE
jgi:prepilin-type N-terminal cleavage/methylation domain-containing protein